MEQFGLGDITMYGQLGLGDNSTRFVPTYTGLDNVIDIATGHNFSLALKADGTLWVWGQGNKGQLGQNNTSNSNVPIQVRGVNGIDLLTKVTQIDAYDCHWVARLQDGTAVVCGGNDYGDLADGTTTQRRVPIYLPNQYNTGKMTGIRKVYAGQYMTGVLKSDGTLWIGGYNNYGQSGIGNTRVSRLLTQVKAPSGSSTLNNIIDVDMAYHVMAISADLELYAWGYNGNRQIGNNSTKTATLPVLIDVGGQEVTYISAGNVNSMAITASGAVYSWGTNARGQIGIGNTTTKAVPTQVLADDWTSPFTNGMLGSTHNTHMALAKVDGTVWTVGYNVNGELGNDTNVEQRVVGCISNAKLEVKENYVTFDAVRKNKSN